jgi:nucleoside-diphosphate-sugar epimerase
LSSSGTLMTLAKPLAAQDLLQILQHTAPLWEEARGQRIFITGGTGFFGCWLLESFCFVNKLLRLEAKATVLTRDPVAFARKCPHLSSDQSVTLVRGDILSFDFPSGEYRYVIHAATETSGTQATQAPLEMLSTIVAGTERALQFATSHGGMKFLFTSSGAVYGKQPANVSHLSEEYTGGPDPLDPLSFYAEGKRSAELLCALYGKKYGLECKIARCWAFCGPHLPLNQHFAIGNFIADVLAGRRIQIQGDGTPRRSYLYAADLAVWLWTILLRAPGLVPFNVGSAHDVSILELAQAVAAALSPRTAIQVAHQPVPGACPLPYVPCVDRARKMLGLRETVNLEESIRRTAEWHKKPE